MKNTHMIKAGFILMLGGVLVFLFSPFVGYLFSPSVGQGHPFLACVMVFAGFFLQSQGRFRRNRERQIKSGPTSVRQFEARPSSTKTAVVSLFLTTLPIIVGILAIVAQGIVHDYHWGLGGFGDHAHAHSFTINSGTGEVTKFLGRQDEHSFAIINAGTVELASAVFFLIVAVGLVGHRIRESRRPGSSVSLNIVSLIVTAFVIFVGGVLVLAAGWLGAMGGS
jgi:ABC-type Fe3+ transport system permease subunit